MSALRTEEKPLTFRPPGRAELALLLGSAIFSLLAVELLWKTLEQWQQRAGLGNSPRTILEELARIQSTDVVLPLADPSGRELRIRCVV